MFYYRVFCSGLIERYTRKSKQMSFVVGLLKTDKLSLDESALDLSVEIIQGGNLESQSSRN